MGKKNLQWSGTGNNIIFEYIVLNGYIFPSLSDTDYEVCLIGSDILPMIGNIRIGDS